MRRSLWLLFVPLVMILPAQAQTDPGAGVIMGNLSFSASSGELYDEARTQFQIGPRGYYFLRKNLGLGGRLMFSSLSEGDRSNSSLLIGPDIAYFFGGGEFGTPTVIPTAGLGLYFNSSHSEDNGATRDETGVTLGMHGGMAIMMGPYLAMLPELEIDFENREGESGTTILVSLALAGFLY